MPQHRFLAVIWALVALALGGAGAFARPADPAPASGLAGPPHVLAAVPLLQYAGAAYIAIAATGMIYLSYFLGNLATLS